MRELYFLRHGRRIDQTSKDEEPILSEYHDYDPSLAKSALEQIKEVANEIIANTTAFNDLDTPQRKNVFIHFSPYLRCCQTADILISILKLLFLEKFPNYKVRFQLLGDFALSEWIHDKMKNTPPFIDSNDAYNMYTPNLKALKNRSACSNFRPTNTLGQYNGLDLSYKDYQLRCKNYFKKLLATYDKPSYIKNQDIIIVISHGYVINNFLSYFINHPIFDEIPEAKINFAKRILKSTSMSPTPPPEGEEYDPTHYTWKLYKDSLNLLNDEDVDSTLNLENDIVYYKTNFIKKDEMNSETKPKTEHPRPSFKIKSSKDEGSIESTSTSGTSGTIGTSGVTKKYKSNPLCPGASEWTPKSSKIFAIKAEFKLKAIQDDVFKKSFSIFNHPSRPISPEVSPNSEPTRSNSVIDLARLVDNDDIYKPMKLKYSNSSSVSIHKLNSKVNSQVNLANYQRMGDRTSSDNLNRNSGDNKSSNSSSTDLPRFMSPLRKRSLSNPINATVQHNALDSYFPLHITKVASNSDNSLDSGSAEDLHIIQEHNSEPLQTMNSFVRHVRSPPPAQPPVVGDMNRSRSLNYKRTNSKSLLAKYQKSQQPDSDDSDDNMPQRLFSLSFKDPNVKKRSNSNLKSSPPPNTQSRNSIKFIPSVLSFDQANAKPSPKPEKMETKKSTKPMFYSMNTDDSDSSDGEIDNEGKDSQKKSLIWFGQNRN